MNNTTIEEARAPDNQKNFTFTGDALEYFSIWIVNTILTILTLGIYSAWAKVRTERYFYSNTVLDNTSFRYLADPIKILKGRILTFGLFVLYYFSALISPFAALAFLLLLLLLSPALVVISMRFRLHNSSFRHVRFGFTNDYKSAYTIFFIPTLVIVTYLAIVSFNLPTDADLAAGELYKPSLLLILSPLLFMLVWPWCEYIITRFKITNAHYGKTSFTFCSRAKDYYKMYATVILVPALVMILIAIVGAVTFSLLGLSDDNLLNTAGSSALLIPIISIIILFYFWFFAYFQVKRTNLIYNNLNLAGHQLQSALTVKYMMYLYITNTLAMALTAGLMMPWAKIRSARYRASVTSLAVTGDLNNFVAAQQKNSSAFGEEMGEIFDMDLGL